MMSIHHEKVSEDKHGFTERMIDRSGGYWNFEARSKLSERCPKYRKICAISCVQYVVSKLLRGAHLHITFALSCKTYDLL